MAKSDNARTTKKGVSEKVDGARSLCDVFVQTFFFPSNSAGRSGFLSSAIQENPYDNSVGVVAHTFGCAIRGGSSLNIHVVGNLGRQGFLLRIVKLDLTFESSFAELLGSVLCWLDRGAVSEISMISSPR